ncbi:MAG: glycosyltransferase family 4 protein [Pyruvatibacter sp.]
MTHIATTPKDGRPRLLMVANELQSFFNHRLPQARAAKAAGYDVHVAMQDAVDARARDTDALTFHSLPLARGFANPAHEMRALLRLNTLVKTLSPQIIHAYTLKPVLYAGLVSRWQNIPLAASVTGVGSFFLGTSPRDKLIQKVLMPALRLALAGRRPCIAIVQNPDDETLVTRQLGVGEANAVRIKGSGVDLTVFSPAESTPPPPVRVVLAARLLADKGVNEFAAAARMLKAQGVDADFILAGTPDPENRSSIPQQTIIDWVNRCSVRWPGHVDDMAVLYRGAHIACLPSYREGLPKALLEAAACGLPIVTTDVPGCRDAIIDGQTGTMVPARDAQALATALRTLIEDPDLRARYGKAGRAFVANGFSVETITQQTLETYERLRAPRA